MDYKIKSFEKRVVGDKSFILKEAKVVFSRSLLRAIHQLVNPFRGSREKVIKAEERFPAALIPHQVELPSQAQSSLHHPLSSRKTLLKYFYDTLINWFN